MAHERHCWKQRGRKRCRATDALFREMEADPHNLAPSIGEANADRSDFSYGILPNTLRPYGQCDLEINFKKRMVEPRDLIRGQIARTYFYMHDRYDLHMTLREQQLMLNWHQQHPVSPWERERNARIDLWYGHPNKFVTGEKTWELNHVHSGEGVKFFSQHSHSFMESNHDF